jgi:cytochrome c biogenesis protein CcdA
LLEIITAAIIGISFGNAWTCIFMSFGTSAEERSVGRWFIVGRFLGLVALGSVISLLRFAAQEAMPAILLIFGISTIAFGLFELIRYVIKNRSVTLGTHRSKERYPTNRIVFSLLSLFVAIPHKGKCGGGHKKGKGCRKKRMLEKRSGFVLGVLRGATPCAKVIVLAPLLVAFGFPQSLLLILVYAGASSMYPIIGYLSADVLSNFREHQLKLKILGAVILVIIGVYTIIKVMMWSSLHT